MIRYFNSSLILLYYIMVVRDKDIWDGEDRFYFLVLFEGVSLFFSGIKEENETTRHVLDRRGWREVVHQKKP